MAPFILQAIYYPAGIVFLSSHMLVATPPLLKAAAMYAVKHTHVLCVKLGGRKGGVETRRRNYNIFSRLPVSDSVCPQLIVLSAPILECSTRVKNN